MSINLDNYKGLKVGDSVKRVHKRFSTEGVVVEIIEGEFWDKCQADRLEEEYCLCEKHYQPRDRRISCEVAVKGDLNNYKQLKKINKDFKINENGQLKMF